MSKYGFKMCASGVDVSRANDQQLIFDRSLKTLSVYKNEKITVPNIEEEGSYTYKGKTYYYTTPDWFAYPHGLNYTPVVLSMQNGKWGLQTAVDEKNVYFYSQGNPYNVRIMIFRNRLLETYEAPPIKRGQIEEVSFDAKNKSRAGIEMVPPGNDVKSAKMVDLSLSSRFRSLPIHKQGYEHIVGEGVWANPLIINHGLKFVPFFLIFVTGNYNSINFGVASRGGPYWLMLPAYETATSLYYADEDNIYIHTGFHGSEEYYAYIIFRDQL